MRTAAQKYYVQQNVFDLRVLSTLGLSQSDIDAIAAVDGVDAVQAVKYQDVEGHWTGDDQTTVARLYQLPADPQADTPENMNRPVLLSGRMPEAAGECVVHVMGHGSPVELGTQLTLPEETEGVSGQVFTVVGTVQDPLHFSSDSESSTVGDGQLDCILFVPEGTLTADYYTVCYIKTENAGLYDNYSDEYQAAVDAVAEKLKAIQSVQCTARREELMDTANRTGGLVVGTGDLSELALGWATYNGDHMSMYGVNAGVPKTLVRHIVQYVADTCGQPVLRDVLVDILDTPVSPELLPSAADGTIAQQTEKLVGPYELHDFYLYYVLRFGFGPAKIYHLALAAFAGRYEPEVLLAWLRNFYRRFFAQQFKRSCLPDGPKVGSVTLSPRADWRMPSDACNALWLKELDEIEAK
jgi:NH3-dependent NAD+ synthetase